MIKQMVGYLPDNFGVYPSLRVWEYLDFFAAAYRDSPLRSGPIASTSACVSPIQRPSATS